MLKTNFFRFLAIIGFALFTYFLHFTPDSSMLSTLFTVLSIFISIGLSIIISFDLTKVKNDIVYDKISLNLKKVRNNFIYYFVFIVFSYIFYPALLDTYQDFQCDIVGFTFNIYPNIFIENIIFSIMVCGIFYYMYNFNTLQNLKDDIINDLRKGD